MCYSFETSIAAGIGSYLVAMYLIYRNGTNDRNNAVFLVTYATIQFVDTILWYDHAKVGLQTCSTTNWLATSLFVPLILALELVVSMFTARVVLPRWWPLGVAFCSYKLLAIYYNTYSVYLQDFGILWGGFNIDLIQFTIYYIFLNRPRSNIQGFIAWVKGSWFIWVPIYVLYFVSLNFGSKWCFWAAALSFLYLGNIEHI